MVALPRYAERSGASRVPRWMRSNIGRKFCQFLRSRKLSPRDRLAHLSDHTIRERERFKRWRAMLISCGGWRPCDGSTRFPGTTLRVAAGSSRLACKRAGKTRTLMPVWDSSGEYRLMKMRLKTRRDFVK